MKVTGRALLKLDRIFWLPYQITRKLLFEKKENNTTDHVFVIKFMGLGSLILFANLCKQSGVDKSKITLLTFSHHSELCRLFGFSSSILIRKTNVFVFIIDCLAAMVQAKKTKPKLIINYERCSRAVGAFANLMALMGNSNVVSYGYKNKSSSRHTVYSVHPLTYQQVFLKGIKKLPRSDEPIKSIKHASVPNKILVNVNSSDYLLARRYPPNLFAELIELLHQWNPQFEFYFTGSLKERGYVQSVLDLVTKGNVFNRAGEWNLEELIHELKSTCLFITGDSGPLHIAALLNCPTLAIWGPTQPAHFGYENHPYIHHISLQMTCSPCFTQPFSNYGYACQRRIDCLNNISPDFIFRKAISILSSTKYISSLTS